MVQIGNKDNMKAVTGACTLLWVADKANHLLTQPRRIPVIIEKSADLEMDVREEFLILSDKWVAEMSKTTLRVNNRPC